MDNTKNTDNCIFYNKYLIDDLLPYKLLTDSSELSMDYSDGSSGVVDCSIAIDKLKPCIEKTKSLLENSTGLKNNQWYPIFIQFDTNATINKTLFRGFATTNDTFGIEEAIKFPAKFKNWDVSGSSDMYIDWFINSSVSPYDTQYGLLCWYQESSAPFTNNVEGLPYEEIPLGLIVRPKQELSYSIPSDNDTRITIAINENSHLMNIDNNKFQILDIKPQQFKNQFKETDKDIFLYNAQINIFDMSQYIQYKYPQQTSESDDTYSNRIKAIKSTILFIINGLSPNQVLEDIFSANNKKTILYISNGDVYSFYNDKSEKTSLLAEGFPSSTYLSTTLFPVYREIWNSLTIDNPKLDSAYLNRKQFKLLQKLCQYLSTFPLIDRVTVNILTDSDIQIAVGEFINNSFKTIDLEIKGLFDILNIIGKKFIDLSVDIKSNTIDHTCYIRNKQQLFNKLLSKYGAYLNIKENTTVKYNSQLPYGPHVKLAQDISSKVKKDTSNKVLFNNFTADIGSFSISSSITASRTYFALNNTDVQGKSTNIPLWDIQKKELTKASLDISAGPDLIIPFKPPILNTDPPTISKEMIYSLDAAELGDIDNEILKGEKLQILWSRVYGPDCLRFSDANLSIIRSEGGIGGANAPTLATPDFSSTNITKHGVAGAENATPPKLGFNDSRYEESTDAVPFLYIKKTGKYILRLKVKASFGTVYDTVTIYVVDNNGEYEPGKKPPPLKTATFVKLQPSNGLTIVCPNMRQFAVGKQGVFWPINSDLSTYDTESNPYGTVAPFGDQIRKYQIPMPLDDKNQKIITNDPVSLKLKYEPNNTIVSLRKITLSHMRDNNPNCENCETFYTNTLDNKGFVVDINRDFTLTDVATKDPNTGKATQLTFSYPSEVSTKYSKIKTYGGYNSSQIDKLGIKIPYSSEVGKILPTITGANMDNSRYSDNTIEHLCFMKSVSGEKPIIFEKGCFHPQSGWLFGTNKPDNKHYLAYKNSDASVDGLKNKTAVINFDPGNRQTFRFKGPGFFNLNNSSNDDNPNKQVYFSTISLNIDAVAQDCYHPGEEYSDLLQCTEADFIANEAQEKPDIDPNHGYRSIGSEFTKLQIITSDETRPSIAIDPDGATASNNYCNTPSAQSYSAEYTFTKRGAYLPLKYRQPKSRFNRSITGAKIEDIEVQVNFMNYANTKNLMIWLDVVPCAAVVRKLYDHYGATSNSTETMANLTKGADRWYYCSKSAPDSIFPNKYRATKAALEALEDGPLKKYLQALFAMNNNPKPENTATGEAAPTEVTNTLTSGAGSANSATASMEGGTTKITADGEGVPWSPTFRLYLLNQEHVEGNRYNFSLRFSDSAGRYASTHDKNYTKHIDPQQAKVIEKDGIIHLLPTVSAFGYDDKDIAFFQNIIRTNNLNTLNNTFAKFSGMDLFQGTNGKLGFGSTKFTLGIAVMNESDSMEVLDSVNNIDQINGIEQTIKTNRSNFLINNVCSWELILHTEQKSFEPVDALGNIKYTEPNISGYNFIANFENQKYLIPPVNLNAPYEYMQDAGLCKYNKEKLNVPVYSYTPLNILPIINVGGAISIFDALGQVASVNEQMAELGRQIYDWFKNERYARQSEEYFRSLYVPKYNRYPMGEPDKALLSVSKDGNLWYSLEASIFRYINSPILKPKKFKYLKLNYKTSKTLGIFQFNVVKYIESLFPNIDDIKIISVPLNSDDLTFIKEIDTVTIDNLIKEIKKLEDELKSAVETLNNTTDSKQKIELQKKIDKLNLLISLCDSTLNSIGTKLDKYDIIKIVKTVTVQADTANNISEQGYNLTKNGIFSIEDTINNRFSLYDLNTIGTVSFNKILKKLRQENLLDFNIQIIPEPDAELAKTKPQKIKNYLIILDGLRPYYFFGKGDPVLVFKPVSQLINELRQTNNLNEISRIEKEIDDLKKQIADAIKNHKSASEIKILEDRLWDKENISSINTIKARGYIHDGDGYKTILELDNEISGSSISKSPEQSNVAIIYDNKFKTIDNPNMPFNKWSFVDTNNSKLLSDNNPETDNCMFGESCYGTGSVLVSPKTLSNKQIKNRVPSLLDLVSFKRARSGTMMGVRLLPNSSVEGSSSTQSESSSSSSSEEASSSSSSSSDSNMSFNVVGYNYTYNDSEYIENLFNAIPINTNQAATSAERRLKLESLFREYRTYTKNEDDIGLMDIHIDIFRLADTPDDGYIELGGALEIHQPTYKFTKAEAKILENRLNLLNKSATLPASFTARCNQQSPSYSNCVTSFWNSIDPNSLYITDLYIYIGNINYITENNRNNKLQQASNRLQSLIKEFWTIQWYCEIGGITIYQGSASSNETSSSSSGTDTSNQNIPFTCKEYTGSKILPTNKIEIIISATDNSLSFIESSNSDDYWINIDPEQSIVLDYSNTVKILVSAEYTCKLVNGVYTLNMGNVCPNMNLGSIASADPDVNFDKNGNSIRYNIPLSKIREEANKYTGVEWSIPSNESEKFDKDSLYVVERNFFLNGLGQERNQLVTATETYLLPKLKFVYQTPMSVEDYDGIVSSWPAAAPDGDVKNKIRNVFNLDDIDKLKIKFKRIPRKWKGIDTYYDINKPNYLGELTRSLIPSPGGPIDHTLKFWHCIDSKTGKYVDIPKYFKWLNEMIFRAYYGSVDGAEHCGRLNCESREISEWIPYDYL